MAGHLGKHPRRLRVEPLEDRRLLAVTTVDTDLDVVDFSDGVTSLREAIFAANTISGADTIEFDPSLSGKTILVMGGEFEITDELTINGLGADQLTIDAQLQSRVFNITADTGDFTIAGLTITQGQTTGDNSDDEDTTFNGGAIRSVTDGLLTIDSSIITGNSTTGEYARGGGVFVYGYIEVTNTKVSDNSTSGDGARGGGISMHVREFDPDTLETYGALTLTDSVVTDNHTTGLQADGGGLDAYSPTFGFSPFFVNGGVVVLNRSEVNHNSTSGSDSSGGGIFATGDVRLDHSEVIGNSSTGVLVIFGGDGGEESDPSLIHNGGGIYSSGRVELTHSMVHDNFTTGLGGGGIRARSGVTLDHSTVTGNTAVGDAGGVLSRGGGVLVTRNSINGVIINQSTISGNSVAGDGGGIYVNGFEPGSTVSSITIFQSTISGNSASESGGGLFLEVSVRGGSTDLSHNTITNNTSDLSGGGLYTRDGTASVDHTIVSGNTDNSGVAHDLYGNIQSSFSLIGDNTGSALTEAPIGAPDANGNLIGGLVGGVIDSQLGPLQNNGGPTLTHSLLPSSPAIDMGDPAAMAGVGDVPLAEQRGGLYTRVFGGRIDIGAYEAQPFAADFDGNHVVDGRDFLKLQIGYGTPAPNATKMDGDADGDQDVDELDRAIWEAQFGLQQPQELPSLVVTTELDVVDAFDGLTSLREAIEYANGLVGADTVEFDASLAGKTILLTQRELLITDDLTVNGLGRELLTIDASGSDPTPDENNGDGSRVFRVEDGSLGTTINVELNDLTLTGGDLPTAGQGRISDGGAIFSVENLSIVDSRISGNSSFRGGGIATESGSSVTTTITRTTISGNQAGAGGGIFTDNENTTTIVDSEISDNMAGGNGGGIFARGTTTITGSTIVGNSSSSVFSNSGGGGIFVSSSSDSTTINGSVISGNSAGSGGGIFGRNETIIMGSDISENTADFLGGGIHSSSELSISGSTILDNSAGSLGGGFFAVGNDRAKTISDSVISGNVAGESGGGIWTRGNVTTTIIGTTISGNSAAFQAGGVGANNGGKTVVTDSTISGNSAGQFGGGIYTSEDSATTITSSAIWGNSASDSGGGIHASEDSVLTVTSSTISGNLAAESGGGILVLRYATIADSTISGNSAGRDGGGVYGNYDAMITNSTISQNLAGLRGGGVFGSVTIGDSTISDNSAGQEGGGIWTSGTTTVSDSAISDNLAGLFGGGVFGGVEITESTISDNSAGRHGGGIFGFRSILKSTISGNSAGESGGGIFANNTMSIYDSTISGNSADANGGGLYIRNGSATSRSFIRRSTIVGNTSDANDNSVGSGGGVFVQQGTLFVGDTIVAENLDHTSVGPDITGIVGSVFDMHFSLIGNNKGSGLAEAPIGMPDAEGNLIGDTSFGSSGSISPLLGPLQDNGGPTLTHALLPGSPAIDMGDPAAMAGVDFVPLTDQRGGLYTRVYGGRIDIGSYELQPHHADFNLDGVIDGRDYLALQIGYGTSNAQKADGDADGDQDVDANDRAIWEAEYGLEQPQELPSLVVTTELDVVNPYDWSTSLREAIVYANTSEGDNTIEFDASLIDKTILLTQGELAITDDLTINGLGAELLSIDASGSDPTPEENIGDGSRILNIDDGDPDTNSQVKLHGLAFTGGDVSVRGGAILSYEDLEITTSTISGNTAGQEGGGIWTSGTTTIEGSTISNNSTFYQGGGIWSSVSLALTDVVISDNRSEIYVAGVYALGTTTILDSTISGNEGSVVGGGIWARGDITVIGNTISGNTAGDEGGGIAVSQGTATIIGNTISGNGGAFGAGISLGVSTAVISDNTIYNNVAFEGGGIWIGWSNVTIGSNTLSGNSARDAGGGVYAFKSAVTISNSTVVNNVSDSNETGAGSGGGLYVEESDLTVDHSIVAQNMDHTSLAPDIRDGNLAEIGVRFSLVGDNTGSGLTEAPIGLPDANGNLIGDSGGISVINPLLGPLQNNGGPTLTHALLPGSPAIDMGDPAAMAGVGDVPLTDQRGGLYTRVFGGRIDIGAVESQPLPEGSGAIAVMSHAVEPLTNTQLADLALSVQLSNIDSSDAQRESEVVRHEVFAALADSPRQDENTAGVLASEHTLDLAEDLTERDLAHERLQTLDDVPLGSEFLPNL